MSLNTSYTIQMASKISGVGVHTIRAWEKRYKALEPHRDSIGHRTYTKSDVEKLMLLSELCLLGYAISKVANLSIPELKLLLKDLGKSAESIDFPELSLIKETEKVDASQSLSILLFALKTHKPDVINQELGKLKTVLTPKELSLEIIMPLADALSTSVSRNEINRHQAEALAGLISYHAGYDLYRVNDKKDVALKNAIVVGIDNEAYDLNMVMAGLISIHYIYNCTYMGYNMSVEALLDSSEFLEANLIILVSTKGHKNIAYLKAYLEKLLQKARPGMDVIINASAEINLDSMLSKRVIATKSLIELDEFFQRKA